VRGKIEGEMKIIKIDKCFICPHITWTTYPVKAICNHDFYKDEAGEIHRKWYGEDEFWKIEDVDVIQVWCVLEDAT